MAKKKTELKTPAEIKAYLDEYVIGQDEAKKILSVAVYNHFKKILHEQDYLSDTEMDKSNIILMGETGSGKTYLAKTIARLLNVPCYIQDCTKVTQAGYVGSDVEDCLVGLLRMCNYDLKRAEMGIVVLDEIDKVAKRDAGPSITRDVQGEGVQQSLLKMVEGDVVGVPPEGGRKHPEQPLIYVNTKNILFIASGAFVGLDKIVQKRMGQRAIGFASQAATGELSRDEALDYATPQDLKAFGMIPEFIGRFPIIANVHKLDTKALIRILTEPRNSIVKQFTELIGMDNAQLQFTHEALEEMADIASELGTGARGLRSILESVMTDIMFNVPTELREQAKAKGKKKPQQYTVVVDKAYVRQQTAKRFRSLAG